MPMAGCEVFFICPFPHQEGTGVRDPGDWDILGTLGGGQERAAHVTPSCWTGLNWAKWVEEGNPRPDCIPASPQGPVVFAWEVVNPCAMNKPAVSALCLQSCLRKAPCHPCSQQKRHGTVLATWFTQLRPVQAAAQGRVTARHRTRCRQRLAGRAQPLQHWAVRAARTPPQPARPHRGEGEHAVWR